MAKKIVIVEDEKSLLKILSVELLSGGFEVFSASNGKSGLALIKKQKPDLVLLDLVMPEKGGFWVLEEMSKSDALKKIPVIILTNLGEEENKKKGLALGAKGYFVKSDMKITNIVKKVRSALK